MKKVNQIVIENVTLDASINNPQQRTSPYAAHESSTKPSEHRYHQSIKAKLVVRTSHDHVTSSFGGKTYSDCSKNQDPRDGQDSFRVGVAKT